MVTHTPMTKKQDHKGTKRCPPLSVRLTPEERQLLLDATGKMPLSDYVRSRLFGGLEDGKSDVSANMPVRLSARERQRLLAQILAKLGETSALHSLTGISEAAELGLLTMSPDVLVRLNEACADINVIRLMLIKSLGKSPPSIEGDEDE